MLPMMEEALVSLQYLPKGRKIWFFVQRNWHETPESLLKETADPIARKHPLFNLLYIKSTFHIIRTILLPFDVLHTCKGIFLLR